MLSTSLVQGLEIVGLVSVMATVLSPVLCWVLLSPFHTETPAQ